MVEYARKKGIYTIVADYKNPSESEAKLHADEHWLVSTNDIDTLEKKCREARVDGVVAGASEFNVTCQIELCERLGLPCYVSRESWHYTKDKADFKAACKRVGAPVPEGIVFSGDLTKEILDTIQYPVMVKPVDCAGNRGISYCYNEEDVISAVKIAKAETKVDKIIIERMLHGREWWAGYALADGEARLMSLNAMYAAEGVPQNCYSLTTTASFNIKQFIETVNDKIKEVLKEIGCREGFAWVQVMLDEDGHFYLIEMGYRLTGEAIFIPLTDLLSFDAAGWIVEYALNGKNNVSLLPDDQHSGFKGVSNAMMLWVDKEGIIEKIEGWEELRQIYGVTLIGHAKPGDKIKMFKPYGNILFTTSNLDETISLIEHINKTVHIWTDKGEDAIIKYKNFDQLRDAYNEGLEQQ